ncbi:hypothetical protein AB4238_17190 [Shewanella sp. 10N.286.45.A1]|uniref:hypothetical protein n=1 Tax=Shewanella sp. 10N.286.45.A1 TaxID=3229694 RepID=UPI0035542F67
MPLTKREFSFALTGILFGASTIALISKSSSSEFNNSQLTEYKPTFKQPSIVDDCKATEVNSTNIDTLISQVKLLELQLNERDKTLDQLTTAIEAEKEREAILKEPYQSAEYVKTAIIPQQITTVAGLVSKRLALPPEQQKRLATLLTAKAEADFDAMSPYMEAVNRFGQPNYSESEVKILNGEFNRIAENNQFQYEQAISVFLSQEQMSEYLKFENEQQQQQQQQQINHQIAELNLAIPSLDNYQKEQIQSLIKEHNSQKLDSVIGASGSFHPQHQTVISSEELQNNQFALESLLSFDQIQAYKSYQSKADIK